jgi:hypothetical protein
VATRYWVGGGSAGNWTSTGNTNWGTASGTRDNASVPTNADDVIFDDHANGNTPCTVSAASTCKSVTFTGGTGWTNTFVINSGQTLTVAGSVTLNSGMTWTASTGTMTISAASTITSNTKAIPCACTMTSAVTYTLGDDVTVNGVCTTGNNSTSTFNGNTLTCAGGHTGTSRSTGTTKFLLTGGNITSNGQTSYSSRYIGNPVEIAGNVTLTNHYLVGGSTITYTSGTITWGAYSIQLGASQTLSGTWPSTTKIDNRSTVTLTIDANNTIASLAMNVNGSLTLAGSYDLTITTTTFAVSTGVIALNRSTHNFGDIIVNAGIAGGFSGAYDVSCPSVAIRAGGTFTFTAGQTLTVSTVFTTCGCLGATTTVKSGSASTAFTITFNGALADFSIYRTTLTDVTFTNACYAYYSTGLLTRTSGVTDFTSNPSFYSDPGEASVKTGTDYKYDSQTNNKTGTYTGGDRWTDPGEANVRLATAYRANRTVDNKTGTCAVPAAANVLSGVAVDATTGTFDEAARNTDPGIAKVLSGTTYKIANASLTGTLSISAPSTADVTAAVSTIVLPGSPPAPGVPPTATDYAWAALQGVV